MKMEHRYGDIYWATIPGYGSDKARPWLIVSNNKQNHGADLQVVPLTTSPPRPHLAHCYVPVILKGKQSYIKCGHAMTVKHDQLGDLYSSLTTAEMAIVADVIRDCHTDAVELMGWDDLQALPQAGQRSYLESLSAGPYTVTDLLNRWGINRSAYYTWRANVLREPEEEVKMDEQQQGGNSGLYLHWTGEGVPGEVVAARLDKFAGVLDDGVLYRVSITIEEVEG